MNPNSTASKLFNLLNFEFMSPSFVLSEFNKYSNECQEKSRLSKQDFISRKKEVFEKIKFIESCNYQVHLENAIKISPDPDDAPYFALVLHLKCFIWSNDRLLKNQNVINIINTEELINSMF